MAVTGMLAELWQKTLPFLGILIIALTPLLLFVFADPDEIPIRFVRFAHTAGSIWYTTVAFGLLFVLAFTAKPLPRGWPVYPLFVMIGAVPCGIVLYRMTRGTYLPNNKVRYEIIPPPIDGFDGILFLKELTHTESAQTEDDATNSEPPHEGDPTSSR